MPELHDGLDPGSVQFLDKELIRSRGGRRGTKIVDLVVRVRFHDQPGFVLIRVEHEGRRADDIRRRLFLYAAWLIDRYRLPVYPVLVTSYAEPRSVEPDRLLMEVRGLRVLDFRYCVVQLNRLAWEKYAALRNPAVTALLTRMKFTPAERAKVKAQMVQLVATMRLTPDEMEIIVSFMETYLKLNPQEELAFQRELDNLDDTKEKKALMQLMTTWERKGRAEGREEGREVERLALVSRQLERKLGPLHRSVARQVRRLSGERLERLAEALLFFTTFDDLKRWLADKSH